MPLLPAAQPAPHGADQRTVAAGQGVPGARFRAFLAVSASAALLLGAEPLSGWSEKLPPRPVLAPLQQAVETWHSLAQGVGLTQPYAAVRGSYRALESARF